MMCRALWLGDRLAERRWPDLFAGQADPLVAVGRPVFSRITSRFRRSGPAPGRTNSALGLAVQAVARPEGVRPIASIINTIFIGIYQRFSY